MASPPLRTRCFYPVAAFFLAAVAFPFLLAADAGVLVPDGSAQPDPSKLSLAEMDVDIRIHDQTARVAIRQIFSSHELGMLEGRWSFALPAEATVSDFAVWDGVVRIPGVILERRRAREIYEDLRAQSIDPGLLEQGQGDASEAARSSVFTARVTPIPGYGFKRIEVEYRQTVPVDDLRSRFALPLRPEAYGHQTAGRLGVRFEMTSSRAIEDIRIVGDAYPIRIQERTPYRVTAEMEARDVDFTEDLAFQYAFAPEDAGELNVLTYRDPQPAPIHPTAWRLPQAESRAGYFLASVLLPAAPVVDAAANEPRTVVAVFDTSLSMQWEKLDRSFRALESTLLALRPRDRFNVLTFDREAKAFREAPVAAERATVEEALNLVRSSLIRGRTDLEAALAAALEQCRQGSGETYLILFSDGGATGGRIANAALAERFRVLRRELPSLRRPRTYIFGVGDEANLPLLEALTREDGRLTHVRSTEPIDFKLSSFLSKIGRRPVEGLKLTTSASLSDVYPLESSRFSGSIASWAGRYFEPGREAVVRLERPGAQPVERRVALPESDTTNPHVARLWARARVDALLRRIERDGEDEDSIEEIIHWSKRFKFVTPYTSFLAAPRSLLRPRVIRPGDPILRVRTDESIVSVTALFPFGLVKKLRFLEGEDVWQTRFLAPMDTPDGEHRVELALRDREGRVYRESKTFLIASNPPTVRAHMAKTAFRAGETVELKVSATKTTRTLTARMYGVPPVSLRWNPAARANTGAFTIPPDLPAGEYVLRLTAEDFAHNIGVEEVRLAVLP